MRKHLLRETAHVDDGDWALMAEFVSKSSVKRGRSLCIDPLWSCLLLHQTNKQGVE